MKKATARKNAIRISIAIAVRAAYWFSPTTTSAINPMIRNPRSVGRSARNLRSAQVPRRPADASGIPDHRVDRARGRGAEPVRRPDRDRDAAADRVLSRGRFLHLPDVA